MRPNLFRSIYVALGERFPLLPRIRRSFWGLLLFAVLFLLAGFHDNPLSVPVKKSPLSLAGDLPVQQYGQASLQYGLLAITNPSPLDFLFFAGDVGIDMMTLLFVAIGSMLLIKMLPSLDQQGFFRKDISNLIRAFGWLLAAHGLTGIYATTGYCPSRIEHLTQNKFTSIRGFPLLMCAELYFAMLVMAVASMYKRSIKMQEENDLTV